MYNFFQPMNSPAFKAHLEAQYEFALDLSQKMIESMQKINELNMQAMRSLVQESLATTQRLMVPANAASAAGMTIEQPLPVAEKIRGYQQNLQNILAEAQADVTKAIESHVPETVRAAETVVTEMAHRVSEETAKAAERQKQVLENITTPVQ